MRGGIFRTIALVCALAVMALRVMLPVGTMLGAGADGRVVVTLCSGASTTIDLGGGHSKPQPHHAPCAFAAVAHGADAPSFASIAAPLAYDRVDTATRAAPARVGQGLAAPPPPATGPPLSV